MSNSKKVEAHLSVLRRAERLLEEMAQEHDRGTMWVPLDSAPCVAVKLLERAKMLRVIKFNDGKYYGQLEGVA